jgi:hypothetical protein
MVGCPHCSPGIHTGFHPFLMGVYHGYYFFFNGLCSGLVEINPGYENTSKDLRLLIIGICLLLHGFQPFLIEVYLGQQAFHHFFYRLLLR